MLVLNKSHRASKPARLVVVATGMLVRHPWTVPFVTSSVVLCSHFRVHPICHFGVAATWQRKTHGKRHMARMYGESLGGVRRLFFFVCLLADLLGTGVCSSHHQEPEQNPGAGPSDDLCRPLSRSIVSLKKIRERKSLTADRMYDKSQFCVALAVQDGHLPPLCNIVSYF